MRRVDRQRNRQAGDGLTGALHSLGLSQDLCEDVLEVCEHRVLAVQEGAPLLVPVRGGGGPCGVDDL
jgi:hypothetical protein